MLSDRPKGTIITIFSTASAVGKTFLAINMAAELANMGYKVCLVDLDLQFGDIGNYLHITGDKTLFDATQVVKQQENMKLTDYLQSYEYSGNEFSVLLAPNKMEQAYNISVENISYCLIDLQRDFDYVVVDTTSAFSELNLAVMDMSTLITFVGIVDFIPTIKNMKIGYDTMRNIGYDKHKIRLVLNRSDAKTQLSLNDVENLLEEKFYHIIPNDFRQTHASVMEGIPVVYSDKDTVLQKSIRQLVGKYTNKNMDYHKENEQGIGNWMKKIFK